MSFLSPLGFSGVLSRLWAEIVLAVEGFDGLPRGRNRLPGQVNGVRSHVGDVALLIEALGYPHRIPSGESQFTVCFLLEGRGRERSRWLARHRALFNRRHGPVLVVQACLQLSCLCFVEQGDFAASNKLPCILIKVAASGEPLTAEGRELSP